MDERNDSIEKRLEQLEGKYRRLRLWCAGVTGLVLVACTAAALAPKENTVRAERFEVLGEDEKVLAVLAGDLGGGETGLRIGNIEDDRAFAMLQVAPTRDPATGRESTAVVLHLESGPYPHPNIFTALACERGAAHYLTNDHRLIGSEIQLGRSRFQMTTTDEQNERVGPGFEDNEEEHARLEVRVEGDKTSIAGSTAAGDVLFRQP